jgi:hypothetical protein
MAVLLVAAIFDLLNASWGIVGFTVGFLLARFTRCPRRRREEKLPVDKSDCFIV